MQKTPRILRAAPLVAFALLAACNSKPTTLTNADPADPDANVVANEAAVVLPPALSASKTYRCKDNSVVYVDFFADNLTADFRTEKTGTATRLTAPEVGKPFAGAGISVGKADAVTTIAYPGHASQSCKS